MKRLAITIVLLLIGCSDRDAAISLDSHLPAWQLSIIEGDYSTAIRYAESKSLGERNSDSRLILQLGELYTKTGQLQKAYELARTIRATEVVSLVDKSLASCVEAFANVSSGDISLANEKSELCYEKHVDSFRPTDRALMADLAHLRGLVLHEMGRLNEAAELYRTSISLRPSSSWDFEIRIAATLNNLANVERINGELSNALINHRKSLALKLAVLPESHVDVSHSWNNIGVVLNDLGRNEEALEFHERALSQRRRLRSLERFVGHSYHNIANSLIRSDLTKAEAYTDSAIALKRKVLSNEHPDVLNSLSLKADILEHLGHLSIADSLRTDLFHQCDDTGYTVCDDITSKYVISGLNLDNPTRAIEYLTNKSSDQEVDKHYIETVLQYSEWLAKNDRFSEAAKILSDVFYDFWGIEKSSFITIPLDRSSWRSPQLLARVILSYSRTLMNTAENDVEARTAIITLTRRSIEIIENDLAQSLPESSRPDYEVIGRQAAEVGMSALMMEKGDEESNWDSSDIFLFSDYLTNWKYQTIFSDLMSFRKSGATSAEIADYKRHILSKSLSTDSLRTTLIERYPLFDLYRPRIRSYAFSSLRERLAKTDAACVLYIAIEGKLIAVVLNAEKATLTNLGSWKEIDQLIGSIPTDVKISSDNDLRTLEELYNRLLRPIENEISGTNIIVVRNRISNAVPFDALIVPPIRSDDTPNYLVKTKSISYTYSAASIVGSDYLFFSPNGYKSDLLAIAPDFGEGGDYSGELKSYLSSAIPDFDSESDRLATLPGAKAEVQSIAAELNDDKGWFSSLTNPRSADVMLGSSNESRFRSLDLNSYRILHFATHSFAHGTITDSSAIILNTSEHGAHDGILYANEIRELELASELVVLSSCDGALEVNSIGAGFSGFATGFLFAGVKNLVASTWPSDDVSTLHLMQRFYHHMANNQPINLALRKAKIDIINMGGPITNPYYWAGFIHIGVPDEPISLDK